MPDSDDAWTAQFEEQGPDLVRARLQNWGGPIKAAAIVWLAQKDREARERAAASEAEQIDSMRVTKAAAVASNALAEDANEVARDANEIARAASASAALSAAAAKTNNIIATLALIAAVIAIAISVMGVFVK
jgi:hypothetical protein